MRSWHLALPATLLVVGAIPGCKEPKPVTQVMLEIRADEGIRAAADNVVVVVYDQDRTKKLEREFDLGVDGVDWPIRVALVPQGGDATRVFEATATARTEETDLASARVISGYLEEQSLLLPMHIWNRCRDVPCEQDETCDELGLCTDATVDPCDAERLEGGGRPRCEGHDGGAADGGAVDSGTVDATTPDGGGSDAGPPPEPCADGFDTPTLVTAINSPQEDCCASLTGDGTDLYFASNRSGGWSIWVAHRSAPGEPFGAPEQVFTDGSPSYGGEPAIASDRSRLYIVTATNLVVAHRTSGTTEFGPPVAVGGGTTDITTPDGPDLTADGLVLLLTNRATPAEDRDLFLLSRSDVGQDFGSPVLALSAPTTEESYGAITADGLGLYFQRQGDVFYAERESRGVRFGPPLRLPLNDVFVVAEDPEVSDDGTELFFNADSPPGGPGQTDILVTRCR